MTWDWILFEWSPDWIRAPSDLGRHHVDRLALGQLHVRLAPVAATADAETEGLVLALHVERVDCLDLDVEELLDRGLDVRLGRVLRHLERILVGEFLQARGLLGNARRTNHFVELRLVHASHSSIFFTAPAVTSTASADTSATGSRPCTSRTST